MIKEKLRVFLSFLFIEILLKSGIILFLTTFACAFLLSITPKEERIVIQIREDTSMETPQEDVKEFPGLYFTWLKKTFKGNLGVTMAGQSVIAEGKEKLLVTLSLSFVSLLLLVVISLFIGLNKNRHLRPLVALIFFFATLPAFFLGYLLIGLFSISSGTFVNYLIAILCLTLSSGLIYEFSRLIDHTMKNEMRKDYIQLARAKGLNSKTLPLIGTIEFHAFRNAIIRICSRIGSILPIVISSSIIIEQVFGIHGLSYMLLDGFIDKDFNRILLVILLAIGIVRLGSIVSNLLYILANPQYKYY